MIDSNRINASPLRRFGHALAVAGMLLFSAFAPHSIAGAEIALAIATIGWILRSVATRSTGFHRSKLDLPIWLFFLWTIASATFSEEPSISIAKLQSVCVFLVFYLTQAVVERRTAIVLVAVMILSGVTGSLFSVYDLLRGRGVIVEALAPNSPFHETVVRPGDAVWRVGRHRVFSKEDVDEVIKTAEPGTRLGVSLITRGEHAELAGFLVTPALKTTSSPSGIVGVQRSHRFRASGWTGHYETFAEVLQILAQLALGLAFANFMNHGANRRFKLAATAAVVLGIGIGLTAMRTLLVALAVGSAVVALRAARGSAKLFVAAGIAAVLIFGAWVVSQTRAANALSLGDDSSSLRMQVAKAGLERIPVHPVFGHGMDAVKRHWSEWGFPGTALIHLHSTPLQIAFDRGVPALLLWLWLMAVCWQITNRAEKLSRDSGDSNKHGILLGATGALVGFFVSSLFNYNWGDGEVALMFWWLMGIVVVLSRTVAAVGDTAKAANRNIINSSAAADIAAHNPELRYLRVGADRQSVLRQSTSTARLPPRLTLSNLRRHRLEDRS